MEQRDFCVVFGLSEVLLVDGDRENDCITHIEGEAWAIDEDGEREDLAGHVSGYLIRIDRLTNDYGGDLIDLCDELSAEAEEIATAIWDPDRAYFKGGLCIGSGNVLVLETVEVEPPFRGQRLGLKLAYGFIRQFESGCALAVCDALPFISDEAPEDSSTKRAVNKSRIRDLVKRLGFKLLKSDIFTLDLALKYPSLAEMMLPDSKP